MPTPNRLANESSPYLKSAAHQPVDWHPWGEEAFAKAQAEDKPVLLDIGAVWCHWCHVIDHESYDDAEVARIINENFVPVKVDRDERPDVDRRYQEAVGAISGQGGWPLTGFLTPDGKVFYGGTYFPKEDMHDRPGFKSVLQQVAQFYRTRKDTALSQAQQLYDTIKQGMSGHAKPGKSNAGMIDEVVRQCTRAFDPRNGGFGTQPKFPHTGAHELLINRLFERNDATLRQIVDTTLTCMGKGGVYDQVAGGFHRYSTDQKWIVPHFEKMSYDNSELLRNYVDAWQLTGNEFYREIAEGIIRWTNEVLSDQERGGFYASQDADIDLEDDGDYFTWTVDEAKAALSEDEFRVLSLHYDIHEQGEMHHNPAKNVLHCAIELPAVAKLIDKSEDDVRALLVSGKQKLAEARKQRPTPFVDTTIYTNWNAMYVAAYLRAWKGFPSVTLRASRVQGSGLGNCDSLCDFAIKTLDRFLAEAWSPEHGFAHACHSPLTNPTPSVGHHSPLCDDQVQMAWALLEAHEVTGDERYLNFARKTIDIALSKFWDEEAGGFFDCESNDNALGMLGARYKPIQDSPNPSTNGVAGLVLARLHHVTGEDRYREKCEKLLNAFAEPALQAGLYAATYFLALEYFLKKPAQVVIIGQHDHEKTGELTDVAFKTFRARKLVQQFAPAQLENLALPSSVRGMLSAYRPEQGALAFVCAGEVCANPTSDPEELANLIRTFGVHA